MSGATRDEQIGDRVGRAEQTELRVMIRTDLRGVK